MLRKQIKKTQMRRKRYRRQMLWRYSRLLCISSLIVLLVFNSEAIHSLLKQQKSLLYLEENNDKAEPKENIFVTQLGFRIPTIIPRQRIFLFFYSMH